MDWGPIIAAGVQIAGGLLADDQRREVAGQDREIAILNLQDRERDRLNALERQRLSNEAALAAAGMSLEGQKKRILGDVLLKQGEGQKDLMLEAYRSSANKPERFNDAASVLAQVLAR